jgi:hypothetical protein
MKGGLAGSTGLSSSGTVLEGDVAALAQQVEGEDRALPGVDPVFSGEVEVRAG